MRPKLLILLLTVASVLSACDGQRQYRSLPHGVGAAVAWNGDRERWHIGAFIEGDRPESLLRVLCITEADATSQFDHDYLLPGINIDVSIAKDEGHGSLEGEWVIDERKWDGVRWPRSHGTAPPSFEAPSEQGADALYQALRDARTATFTSLASIDDSPLITTTFDLTSLFVPSFDFAFDNCNAETINQRLPSPGRIDAYWLPEQQAHFFSTTVPALRGQSLAYLICAPASLYDEFPAWLDEDAEDIALIAGLILDTEQEAAQVVWSSNVVGRHAARWQNTDGLLTAGSHHENLKFYDALRRSDVLDLTVEIDDLPPVEIQLHGAATFAMPLANQLHGCVQDYADIYGEHLR